MLLVFNVDGRAYDRDKGTTHFPSDMRSDYKTVDDAWVAAKEILTTTKFKRALQAFPGFKDAELVLDENGEPVVGDVLYLRETIHSGSISQHTLVGNSACSSPTKRTNSGSIPWDQ